MSKIPSDVDAWVDFNELQGRYLTTLFKFMRSKEMPRAGDFIVIGDFDGTRALAKVFKVERDVIYLTAVALLPYVGEEETFTDITDEIDG